ncbi:MAG: PIN domain-containing protein [Spirochaetes bacterium]|nr:PIN domain-containing protein [Spirochaetota bacterium]
MIIIDTTIWSKAYRRRRITNEDQGIVTELFNILEFEQEVLVGSVRQELLSGVSDKNVFHDLTVKLNGFNNYEAQLADHDLAAEYFNICSTNGIQGSQTDYLICAIAYRYNLKIFTEDKDFSYYKKYLPIKLHEKI